MDIGLSAKYSELRTLVLGLVGDEGLEPPTLCV